MSLETKRTVLLVLWAHEDGASSIEIDVMGEKLPDKIKVMLADHLIRELDSKIEMRYRG